MKNITAKRQMQEALPTLLKLLNDPEFVKIVTEAGYRIDVEAIFKIFVESTGWKLNEPLVKRFVN